jgi:RimJ/RimL family protein N-acetyltransferase
MLEGLLVILKPLQEVHIAEYLSSFSTVVQQMLHVSDHACEHEYLKARMADDNNYFFCIFLQSTMRLIGAIDIRDQAYFSGQLYCWLNEQYWGVGVYQEALALASRAYFLQTHMRYMTARVDVYNERSYYALRKGGFAQARVVQGPYGKQYEMVLRNKFYTY